MRDEVLTPWEIRELGNDVGMKNIANVFDKFKHQHNLFDAQQKEEEFSKTYSYVKRKNFEVPLERRTTMNFTNLISALKHNH